MDEKSLQHDLESLKEQAHQLAMKELDSIGDPGERYRQASALNVLLVSLKPSIDASLQARRPVLEGLYESAERDLFFVVSEGESRSRAAVQPESLDLASLARQINGQAFTLAQTMAGPSPDSAALTAQARQLDDQIKGLVSQPGYQSPEVQSLMSEAVQDLRYVLMGGRGPMSLRLYHFLQERNK